MADDPIDLDVTIPDAEVGDPGVTSEPLLGAPADFVIDIDDDGGGPYYGFGLAVSIAWDSGLAFAPSSGSKKSRTVVWRVSAETSMKVVTFSIARLASPPKAPHVDTGTPNDVLFKTVISTPIQEVLPDGTRAWIITGQYLYVMQFPQDPHQPILIPNNPLLAPGMVQLYPSDFSRLLTGPASPPPEYDGYTITY